MLSLILNADVAKQNFAAMWVGSHLPFPSTDLGMFPSFFNVGIAYLSNSKFERCTIWLPGIYGVFTKGGTTLSGVDSNIRSATLPARLEGTGSALVAIVIYCHMALLHWLAAVYLCITSCSAYVSEPQSSVEALPKSLEKRNAILEKVCISTLSRSL